MANKDAAIDFLKLCAAGRAAEAFAKYAAKDFRHHNPHFAASARSLSEAMDENARKNPGKVFEVQRALEDGDLVAVHSRVRMQPGGRDIAVVHIFRFVAGRVAELWDIGQEAPEKSQNSDGMF